MSKWVVVLYLGIFLFLVGCKTNTFIEYTKPDFSDSDILKNEVERIRETKDSNAVEALWLSSLLYSQAQESITFELLEECFDYSVHEFYRMYGEKQWQEGVRVANSIITLTNGLIDDIGLNVSEDFIVKYESAVREYHAIPQLKEYSETSSTGEKNDISTFITGVVTVWVDLGVKVEGGLGYPNRSLGSGFFIDERGYIITNHHVISELVDPEYEGYSRLYIKLSNDSETRIPAKVVGWDKTLDLALLKTEITPPYVYSLGTSQNLAVGNPIYAIGSPVGLENTITSGIISAFDRQLLATAAVMQIDAAVNSGNSGGPLINTNGEVQGVVFAGLASFQGLNFAIPVEYLKSVMLRLYSEGDVTHSWIGALGRTIREYPSDEEGLGVEVLYVMPGSSAHKADIEPGNIITAINGVAVNSLEELQFSLIQLEPMSIVTIEKKDTIADEATTLSLYLQERPEYPGFEIYEREPSYRMVYPLFGMELIPSSVGNKDQFTIQSIIKGSIADESGFSVHDPVEIRKTVLSENKDAVFIETFTKKRKSGYFEVNVAIGAGLDSPFIF